MVPIVSSNIEAAGYDPIGKIMHVRFKNGSTYAHHDVSSEDHARFMASGSKGKHYHRHLKDRFGVRKIGLS